MYFERTKEFDDFIDSIKKSPGGEKHYLFTTATFDTQPHRCYVQTYMEYCQAIIDEKIKFTDPENRTRAILLENINDLHSESPMVYFCGHRFGPTYSKDGHRIDHWYGYKCGMILYLENNLKGRTYSCKVKDAKDNIGEFCSLPWKLNDRINLYERGLFDVEQELHEGLKWMGFNLPMTPNTLLPDDQRKPEPQFVDHNFKLNDLSNQPANKAGFRSTHTTEVFSRLKFIDFSQHEKNSQYMFDKSLLNQPKVLSASKQQLNMAKYYTNELILKAHQVTISDDPNIFYTELRHLQTIFYNEWQLVDQEKVQKAITKGGKGVGRVVRKATNCFIHMFNQIDGMIHEKRITIQYNQKYQNKLYSVNSHGMRIPLVRQMPHALTNRDILLIFVYM